MSTYITIDGGTTNTRISLVKDGSVADTLKKQVGARNGIDDRQLLRISVKEGIEALLERNDMKPEDVHRILASGMISSEFGFCNVEHIQAPAGIRELHDTTYETVLSDISDIPFVFIRGVKIKGENVEETDVMRGEETELMGILQDAKSAYILPGSHSKIIRTDEQGRIVDFATALTGEMIASLSGQTILKDAVDLSVTELDSEYLLQGYQCCERQGINKALFKVRLLKTQFGRSKEQIYSYFMGIVLHDEIEEVLRLNVEKIVIGGRKQIKEALQSLITALSGKEVLCITDEEAEHANIRGMIRIFEYGL